MKIHMPNALTLSIPIVTVIIFVAPVDAQNLPWCAIMDNDGTTQCNYYTQQQCLQTISGIGGACVQNSAGSTPQLAPSSPSSENTQGLLPLQLQDPGPPPGLAGSSTPSPPDN